MSNKSILATLILGATLASCGGGGGSGTGGSYTGPSKSWQTSSYISAQSFVEALNDVDGSNRYASHIVKDQYETERGSGNWFVIYDAKYDKNVSVSLSYLRTLEYYDFYSSDYNLADEYRDVNWDDMYDSGYLGDGYGDEYEEVVYTHSDFWEDYYIGLDSGKTYNDETDTYDVSLMAREAQENSLLKKAADVSATYGLEMKDSLSLVSLGVKATKMLSRSSDEMLLPEDAQALKADIESFTGATFEEFQQAQQDNAFKQELIERVSKTRNIKADSLVNRLLPDLGIEL